MKSHSFELLKAFHIASAIAEFIREVFTPLFTALFFASVLCTGLIVVKVLLSGTVAFAFLIWNLFLAWVPFLISKGISFKSRYDNGFSWKLSLLWLAFFPNAPYLITDFVHLNTHSPLFWLDVLILFSCAITGLALGIASLLKMHDILLKEFGKNIARAIITLISSFDGFWRFSRARITLE